MSAIIDDKEGVKYVSGLKMVALGKEASQRRMDGKDPRPQMDEGQRILKLLKALRYEDYLSITELEGILYCLRNLSGEYQLPTIVPPVFGNKPTYLLQTPGPSGPPGPPGNDAVVDVISDPAFDNISVTQEVILGVKTFKLGYNPYTLPEMVVAVQGAGLYEQGTTPDVSVDVFTTAGRETLVSREIITPVRIPPLALVNSSLDDDETFVDAAVAANATYLVRVNDGVNNVDASDTVNFYYPFLYGASDDVLPTLDPYLLGGKLIQAQGNKAVVLNGTDKYFYFCYPASYPDLAEIKDQNGFVVTGAWEKITNNVQGTNAKNAQIQNNWDVSYKIYKTLAKTDISSAQFTFNF